MAKKGGLGKGLDLIFAENTAEEGKGITLKISEIEPNRSQPRKDFDDAALSELADSIAAHGVIQPLLVRPLVSGGYQIVAGERRFRAARMAGLTELPVIIRELDDAEFMEIALIENLQREDLSPLEEANGYRALMETHGLTQEEISKNVGKSRSAVANALRLLGLPEEIQDMIEEGSLSAGHGRTLLSFRSVDDMKTAARKTADEGLSVRSLEKLAKKCNGELEAKTPKTGSKIRFYEEAQLALNSSLGRKVSIDGTKKKGVLRIEFYGEDDLKVLLSELTDKY